LGAVIAKKESLAYVRRAMSPYPVNLAALVAALAALDNRKAIRAYVKQNRRTRDSFAAELQKLGVITFPSAGNFLLADFESTGPALFQKLERNGILLRPRGKDSGPGFVRITVGTPREMKLLLREIRKHRSTR
jgi:histidinol-phosphate aminotransferase